MKAANPRSRSKRGPKPASKGASFAPDVPIDGKVDGKVSGKAGGKGSGGGGSGGGQPPPAQPRWKRMAYGFVVLSVWGLILSGLGMAYIAWDLPDVNEAIQVSRKPVIRILTQDGQELTRRGDRYGTSVRLENLPLILPQAILATEDRRFYSHFGLDLIGIARAMWINVKAGAIRQGGSTLTQQAAKNLFLKSERTFRRKFQEVLLAFWLEAKFTKDEILTIYMNRVYFGQSVYGVDAAARYYFGVPASDLSDYHAAMLAGMLKGPNKYNPFKNLDLAKSRTEVVLKNMVHAGYFSQADADAVVRPKRWRTSARNTKTFSLARHYTDWVLDQVGDYVTLDQDVVVFVSLDTRLQKQAMAATHRMMKKGGTALGRNASEVALVTLATDGSVLAMVGGRDYNTSRFNRAVQAKRQPGSAFKPIVYLAGFDAGLTPATVMIDEPITIDNWSPKNFKKTFAGSMTLAEAMMRSVNTIAVKVSEEAGRSNVQAMAKKLGITTPLTDKPSLALGVSETSVLDLTAAYGTFATGGFGLWPYAIVEIQDASGHTLYQRSGGGPGRVIPPSYAGAMNAMLSGVVYGAKGTGKAARLGNRPAAGKTGTSQGYRDAWFVGYTADLITGVWMGNDAGTPMQGVTGGSLPARLWKDFMLQATAGYPVRPLPSEQLPTGAHENINPQDMMPRAEQAAKDALKTIIDSLFGN
ncbi:MAG: PBP1A family penicillin-binding protein [Magnetovibrio sp.]|nr:PBP1A family penicillin-binding protein [Magnetovibrio sp.]